jgi:hypothetical protein
MLLGGRAPERISTRKKGLTIMQTHRPSPSTTREAYRQKYDAELQQWEAKLTQLKAESRKWSANAKLTLDPYVHAADRQMNETKQRLDRIEVAAEDKWETFKGDMEQAWADLKAKIEGAYDAVKNHHKN